MTNVHIKLSQLYGWAGSIVALLIVLWLTWRTFLHHFVIGLLIAAIVLFVAIALFEGIWRGALYFLRKIGFQIER